MRRHLETIEAEPVLANYDDRFDVPEDSYKRRREPHREPSPPLLGAIGFRAVQDPVRENHELSLAQLQVDGLREVEASRVRQSEIMAISGRGVVDGRQMGASRNFMQLLAARTSSMANHTDTLSGGSSTAGTPVFWS